MHDLPDFGLAGSDLRLFRGWWAHMSVLYRQHFNEITLITYVQDVDVRRRDVVIRNHGAALQRAGHNARPRLWFSLSKSIQETLSLQLLKSAELYATRFLLEKLQQRLCAAKKKLRNNRLQQKMLKVLGQGRAQKFTELAEKEAGLAVEVENLADEISELTRAVSSHGAR